MIDGFSDDTVSYWVGDFLDAPGEGAPTGVVREYAPEVLTAFLRAACAHRGVEPDGIEERDLKPALLEGVAVLEIPPSVREDVPALCAAFLEALERQGRLGGGGVLGRYVRALKPTYLQAASGKGQTYVAPASKVGRNDPCPCGSGRKFKKCCQGRLGGAGAP